MDIDWQVKLILLLVLFFVSAFFSGSEVALFSLDRKKLSSNLASNPLIYRYLTQLLDHPKRLLVTILLGNTIGNVAASIIAVSLALQIASGAGISADAALTVQIIVLTILVIIFGEITPKVWASKKPLGFARVIAIPMYWTSVLIYPAAEFITELIKLSVAKFKFVKSKSAIDHQELIELANLSHERGTIEEDEHGLIHSIVTFRTVLVHEVMTPRVDMVCISADTEFNELIDIINLSGHSRLPLYKNSIDEIIGVIYAKDILPFIKDPSLREKLSLEKIARKVMFIPRTKMISDLMREFQEKKMHIAIVVDEYGGTAGLITLEDIIEEIIGEIQDEYDKEENPVTKVSDNSYIVLGKFSIEELNELLGLNIVPENEDYETVAGLVLNNAGQIPKEGYSFTIQDHKFSVKEVSRKRINKVAIEKLTG